MIFFKQTFEFLKISNFSPISDLIVPRFPNSNSKPSIVHFFWELTCRRRYKKVAQNRCRELKLFSCWSSMNALIFSKYHLRIVRRPDVKLAERAQGTMTVGTKFWRAIGVLSVSPYERKKFTCPFCSCERPKVDRAKRISRSRFQVELGTQLFFILSEVQRDFLLESTLVTEVFVIWAGDDFNRKIVIVLAKMCVLYSKLN